MDTERAEAIVLRVQPVTESSLLITWFTREFGKLKTLSKGARRPKSPVRGKIDLFYLDEIVFLRSRRSDLHLLSDCFLENPRSMLRTSLELLTTASYLVESVDLATEPEDANAPVFELLDETLEALPGNAGKALAVWFDLQLLKATGWAPKWPGGSGGDKLLRSLMGATLAGVQRVRLTEEQTYAAREATGRLWDDVVGRRAVAGVVEPSNALIVLVAGRDACPVLPGSATVARMSTIILKRGKERRLVAGHCWVYAGEIDKTDGDPVDGAAVEILDHKGRPMGRGLFNSKSQIAVRRFTMLKEELDKDFFRRRLQAAINYRQTLGWGENTCRLVSSEGDLLPGLIVDRFGDHLVLQALTLGIDQRKPMIVELLRSIVKPQAILERSDVPSRKFEGLEEFKGVLWGDASNPVTISVGGVQFEVNLLDDQKTGFFLDQAENYTAVAGLCAGKRVLDCFSYHGGFGLFAAKAGATRVQSVEISEPATQRAQRNAQINDVGARIEFVCANAFDTLKKYDVEKRQFDVIILDPPTFTRTKDRIEGALRGYKEINLRAFKMLPVGGVLATFSCSHHITPELFREVIVAAAADAKKTVRLVKALTQSPDHPVIPAIPETEYLKGFLLQVI